MHIVYRKLNVFRFRLFLFEFELIRSSSSLFNQSNSVRNNSKRIVPTNPYYLTDRMVNIDQYFIGFESFV